MENEQSVSGDQDMPMASFPQSPAQPSGSLPVGGASEGAPSIQQTAANTPSQARTGTTPSRGRTPEQSLGAAPSGTPFGQTPNLPRRDIGYAEPQQRRRSMSVPVSAFTVDENSDGMVSGFDEDRQDTYVWGTNVTYANVASRFKNFVLHFQEDPDQGDSKYMTLLRQVCENGEITINIDCHNMADADATLYNHLISCPGEVITIMDLEVRDLAAQLMQEDRDKFRDLQVKPFNLMEVKVIRDLNPSDVNKLISVSGMVTRTSNIIPDLRMAVFGCEVCQAEEVKPCDRGRIDEPAKCAACGSSMTMKLLHNRSFFNNKQLIKMQENPNSIPEGETPHAVSLFVYDEMVDVAKPGDRITVTGMYKAVPLRLSPTQRALKSIWKTFIDIVHVDKNEANRMFSGAQLRPATQAATSQDSQDLGTAPPEDFSEDSLFHLQDVSREEVEAKRRELEALAADPDIYEKLAASLAPSIWQLEDVKKGILCQLFGGSSKVFDGGRTRGDLNVLLVGDPGVAKSQLLSYVNKIAPRGIYTSGRGSSAVGLTAYVTKDPETKEMVLESGALVLSDRGICCIDEFDKMSDSARSMLHEVMEQQTVSVAKAGIISTLNARTSVLASANPVGSRYNPRLSIIDNIDLPPSLMSRFDLIYLLLDKSSEASDRKLARFLIQMYWRRRPAQAQAVIPMELLKEYIAYARAACQPQLSDEAGTDLIQAYLNMRRQGLSRKVITATPRQLESLVRLSEALARMRLGAVIQRADVAEAVRLMTVAMQQSATDPTTGTIDMDLIQTGISAAARVAKGHLTHELLSLVQQSGAVTVAQLLAAINEQSSVPVTETELKEALRGLGDEVEVNWTTRTVKYQPIVA